MNIRNASYADLDDVLRVERAAFGSQEEANLVRDLLGDASAQPTTSLLAFNKGQPVGHILFTHAQILVDTPLSAAILAPLAVIPEFQKQGIGGELIKHGCQLLSASGVGLVFVLGYPGYYSRFGFQTANQLGFEAPFPIAAENADAWMVLALRPELIGTAKGRVICADSLNKPEYWRE